MGFSTLLLALAVTSPAEARSRSVPPESAPWHEGEVSSGPAPDPRAYTHSAPVDANLIPMGISPHIRNGFYCHAALGAGVLTVLRNTSISLQIQSSAFDGDSRLTGDPGATFELALGGSPARDLVLMAQLYAQSLHSGQLVVEGGETLPLGGSATFLLIGGGVLWYPWSGLGFHTSGAVGATTFTSEVEDAELSGIGGTGVGGVFGAGYDWWIGPEWSLGVGARFFTAGMSGTTEDTIRGLRVQGSEFDFVLSGSLLIGVTYL